MFELTRKESASTDSAAAAQRSTQPDTTRRTTSSATPQSGATAVIGRSIQIRGDLRGDEDIRIEGDIEGSIHLPNHALTIGREGRVRADAYAKSVIIDGETQGDVYGAECVTIREHARVTGNILASRVSLEEGARFKGSIDMDPESVKRALAQVAQSHGDTGDSGAADKKRNGADKPARLAAEKSGTSAKANSSISAS
jgi:cytoskeletal protein CcmA (bactofilin family)